MLRQAIAVVIALIGIAAALDYVWGIRYVDAVRDLDREAVLGPLMAVGIVLALIVNFAWKRSFDADNTDGAVTRAYLEANLAFYTTVLLAFQVFREWIGNVPSQWWQDPLFVVVMGVTSLRLWRDRAAE